MAIPNADYDAQVAGRTERIAPLAEASGQMPHAWTVDALRRQAALTELRVSARR